MEVTSRMICTHTHQFLILRSGLELDATHWLGVIFVDRPVQPCVHVKLRLLPLKEASGHLLTGKWSERNGALTWRPPGSHLPSKAATVAAEEVDGY